MKIDGKVEKLIMNAKTLSQDIPIEAAKYSSVCFNYAYAFYVDKDYKKALPWIMEAIGVYENIPDPDVTKLVKFLQLGSDVLIHLENFEKAYALIVKCNEIHCTPKSKVLQLRLELQNGAPISIVTFSQLVQSKPSVDLIVEALELITNSTLAENFVDSIQTLLTLYSNSSDIVLIRFALSEFFLLGCKDSFRSGDHLEFVLSQVQSGKSNISREALERMQCRLWSMGRDYMQQNQQKTAIFWFSCSLRLMQPTDSANRAKALRFIARAHLDCKDLIEAKTAVNNSLELVPNSLQGLHVLFQILCLERSIDEATKVLVKITNHESFHSNEYLVLAHFCFENEIHNLTIKCLEKVMMIPDQKNILEIGHAIVQLCLKDSKLDLVNYYCTFVLEKINNVNPRDLNTKELEWFKGQTWNLGTQCTKSEMFMLSYHFYNLSFHFMSLLPVSIQTHTLMVTSLIHRIYMLSKAYTIEQDANLLHKGIKDCVEARSLLSKLVDLKSRSSFDGSEEIHQKNLILILDFSFKLELEFTDQQFKDILDQCSKEGLSAKVFVTLGGLAFETTKRRPEIAQEAYKKAIFGFLNEPTVNLLESLRCYIRLIQISPKVEPTSGLHEDILRITKNVQLNDEMENQIRWIVCNAWNNGVKYQQAMNTTLGEHWMKIASSLSLNLKENDDLRFKIQELYQKFLESIKKKEQEKSWRQKEVL